jgi:rhodanese-related sulfurtransferase
VKIEEVSLCIKEKKKAKENMMKIIYKYKLIIAVVLPVLILVLIRSFNSNHFKNDSKKWAEPSVNKTNIINIEQTETLSGNKLFINLDKKSGRINEIITQAQNIPSDSILDRKYLKIIMKQQGPVLLYSAETAVSARIWMILSQLGFRNIYIITNDVDNEVFKSKFRADTLAGT